MHQSGGPADSSHSIVLVELKVTVQVFRYLDAVPTYCQLLLRKSHCSSIVGVDVTGVALAVQHFRGLPSDRRTPERRPNEKAGE